MGKDVKAFHALGLENGETCIISTDKRQMARWYALVNILTLRSHRFIA